MGKGRSDENGTKTPEVSSQGKELPALYFPFTCNICEATKPTKKCKVLHRKKSRQEDKLSCPHCRTLFRVEELESHWPSCATRKFVCNICHLKFKAVRYLVKHTIREHNVKLDISDIKKLQTFEKCPHCSNKYASGTCLVEHIRKAHKPTKCGICGIIIHGSDRATYHEIREHTEPAYECTKCLKKYHWKHQFQYHSEICNPGARSSGTLPVVTEPKGRNNPKRETVNPSSGASDIKCPRCHETLPKAISLDRHMQTHHEKITCDLCGTSLTGLYLVQKHQEQMHEKSIHNCPHCSLQFSGKASLKKHASSCMNYKVSCELCGRKFSYLISLKNHMKIDCSGLKKRLIEKYKCPHCTKRFQDQYGLRKHMTLCAGEKHTCKLCNHTFKTLKWLTCHMNRMHAIVKAPKHEDIGIVTGTRKSLKESNGRSLALMARENGSPKDDTFEKVQSTGPRDSGNAKTEPKITENISSRSRVHNANEIQTNLDCKHSCEVCGQTFKYLITLNSHRQQDCIKALKQRQDNRYQCAHCPKRFSAKDSLRKHVLVCANQKHGCELCSRRCNTLKQLKFHIRRMHKVAKPSKIGNIKSSTPNEHGEQNSIDKVGSGESSATSSKASSPSVTQKNTFLTLNSSGEVQIDDKTPISEQREADNPSSKSIERGSEAVQANLNYKHSCDVCGRTFTFLATMNDHKKRYCIGLKMRPDEMYQCAYCLKRFSAKVGLKVHLLICATKKHKCEVCGKKYKTLRKVRFHTRRMHGITSPKHVYTETRTPTEDRKQSSVDNADFGESPGTSLTRNSSKEVQADVENLTSEARNSSSKSNEHTSKEVPTNANFKLSCTMCGRVFRHLNVLNNHKKRGCDGMYQCDHCPKKFSDSAFLQSIKNHMIRVHKVVKPLKHVNIWNSTPTEDRKHSSVDSTNSSKSPTSSSERNSGNKSFNHGSFEDTRKIARVHDERGCNGLKKRQDEMYQCAHCPKRFSTKDPLRKHVLLCANQRHSCKICGQSCRTLKQLRLHIRRMHKAAIPSENGNIESSISTEDHKENNGDEADSRKSPATSSSTLYQCPHCPKKFRNSGTLEKHGAVCAARKYPCKLCDKNFKSPKFVENHMIRVHKVMKPLKHVNISNPTPKEDHNHNGVNSRDSGKSPTSSSGRSSALTSENKSFNCSPFEDLRTMVHVHDAKEVGMNSLKNTPLPENIELKMEIKVEDTMLQEQELFAAGNTGRMEMSTNSGVGAEEGILGTIKVKEECPEEKEEA